MGRVLHGSATTTEAVRRAIRNSEESLRVLARRHGINQKTVAKWKKRTSIADLPTGPKEPRSTVLTEAEEAMVVAFRRHTLLPLDDCLYVLQPTIPHLTRSSLHRCLQRHDISRLPEIDGDKPAKKKFKAYPLGYFHVDIAEVQTAEGKLYIFVAIDSIGTPLVRETMAGGIQFTNHERHIDTFKHIFDRICREHEIEHRLTKIKHPWISGQAERMNRPIKDVTVKRFHQDDHDQLRNHLANFISAYNFGRRLKTLKGLTPCEVICKAWTSEPDRFTLDPTHHMPGLNT